MKRTSLPDALKAWLNVFRVGNATALGFATLVGFKAGGGELLSSLTPLLFLTGFTIGAGGNAVNDYFDRDIDAINKPWRPIPSGLLKPSEVYAASIVMLVIGVVLSVITAIASSNYVMPAVALFASILVYSYSWRLKRVLIVGNLVVAGLASLSILYGGLASGNVWPAIYPTLYAFLLNLGREFMKGLEDVEGDRRFGVQTLAVRFGPRVAYIAATAVLVALIAISPIPYFTPYFRSIAYIVLASVVDASVLYAIIVARTLTPQDAWRSTRVMKVSAFTGLIAFFAGSYQLSIL